MTTSSPLPLETARRPREGDSSDLVAIASITAGIASGCPATETLRSLLEIVADLAGGSQATLLVPRNTLPALIGQASLGLEERWQLSAIAFLACEGPFGDELSDWEGTREPVPSGDNRRLLLPQPRGGIVICDAASHILDAPQRRLTLQILAELSSGEVLRASKLAEAGRRKQALEDTRARLREQNALLRELAVVDELTGLHNRRYFERRLAYELDRVVRYKRPLTLGVIDVDHFKRFNDTWGHDVGDAVLKRIAELCQQSLRRVDLVARYGGEEFVALLPETPLAGGETAMERLRVLVAETAFEHAGHDITVSVSVGLAAAAPGFQGDAQSLFRSADQALYRAKGEGRNRVVVAERDKDEP